MVDYSSFLEIGRAGRVWWQLSDAIKLGAGFRPGIVPSALSAPSNREVGAERDLKAVLHNGLANIPPPRTATRDNAEFVPACEFLDWLARVGFESGSGIAFPFDLALAVAHAESAAAGRPPTIPLMARIAPWLSKSWDELPEDLRREFQEHFWLHRWDDFGEQQRFRLIADHDFQKSPALQHHNRYWFELFSSLKKSEKLLETWESAAAVSVADLETKETRLTELRAEMKSMQDRLDRLEAIPRKHVAASASANQINDESQPSVLPGNLIPYTKAMARLRTDHDATPDELAVWVWLEKKNGGIDAFYVDKTAAVAQFRFPYSADNDFNCVEKLMGTQYLEAEIANFKPKNRYTTGAKLRDRWKEFPDIDVDGYIREKIRAGELHDFHPLGGKTMWHPLEGVNWAPREAAMFAESEVNAIEQAELEIVPEANGLAAEFGKPVNVAKLIEIFQIRGVDDQRKWWGDRTRDAKKYGLQSCRASKGKGGKANSSAWYPAAIAAWLVDRKHLTGTQAAKLLRDHFPECADTADRLDSEAM